jgi:DHA2 family multidrug resistance protein-like MFS transporter
MSTTRDERTHRAGRREWLGLAVLALPALLISLDFSVLTLAVPKISEALHPTASELLWIVEIYGFLLAGFLVTMGSLGDRIGRRRVLLLGASVFGLGSILAAFSSSAWMLILARALLGVAGATLLPSTLALINAMFSNEHERTKAIAMWSASLPIGGAIGPLVGGALLNYFQWGSVFLISVPAMIILLIAGPVFLPEHRDSSGVHPDMLSVGLSLVAVLTIIYGLQEFAIGEAGAMAVMAVATGVGCIVIFVDRQRRLEDPLIDLRLFLAPVFSVAITANLFSYFVVLGMLMLFAQYLQLVLGLSPLAAGGWTMPVMGGLILGSLATPLIAKRTRPVLVISGGLMIAAVGFGLLSRIGDHDGDIALAVTAMAITCVGIGLVTTLVVNVVLATAPPERAGAASGLSETSTELGGALGIAGLGTLATVVYRTRLGNAWPGAEPTAIRSMALNSLGGALDAAARLPAQASGPMLLAARHAFTAGLRTAAVTSAIIVFALAIVVLVLLRTARNGSNSMVPPSTKPDATAAKR